MLDLSRNHFELFGLPVAYVVDQDALRDNYRELQRVVHPDRYADRPEQERRLSMQGAAQINEAFQTLQDPVARARYLLALHGVEMQPDHETTRDTAFLMEQLQLREELEGLRTSADPLGGVQDFLSRIDQAIRTMISQMAVDFETPDAERLDQIRERVRKMQFLKRLYAEAEALEAEIEDGV
jgi:molecular chaperone HscB